MLKLSVVGVTLALGETDVVPGDGASLVGGDFASHSHDGKPHAEAFALDDLVLDGLGLVGDFAEAVGRGKLCQVSGARARRTMERHEGATVALFEHAAQ